MNRRHKPKVICVGLGKTGTTTFAECMKLLGFRHLTFGALEEYSTRNFRSLKKIINRYDSLDDFPWPYLYKFIDKHYPGSKFILTRRQSTTKWFDSLCRHYDRTGPTQEKRIYYGYYSPYENPGHHIRLYEAHCSAVRGYFSGRPEFLEVCWEDGDSWGELCGFLNLPTPGMPFPKANAAPKELNYESMKIKHDKYLDALKINNVAGSKENNGILKSIIYKCRK